jgi:arylsulfatase A-like enzyme
VEETRIPLVIRHPGRIPAGRRVRDQASIMDIAPTLLELVGLAPLPAAVGRSLVPALGPEGQIKSLPTVLELNVPALQTHLFALRTLPWKLIYDLNRRQVQAYDLAADPRERAPLPPDKAPVPQAEVGELYQRKAEELDAAARRLPPVTERDTPPIPTMTKEQLRALGYLK